jgi:3-hydroxyisobutyrate dehydrogenase-like beta-hydroxyacid dehydrogenase
MANIGFIGLGVMGQPTSKNLLHTGHAVVVYIRSAPAVEEVVRAGASFQQIPGLDSRCFATRLPVSPCN